MLNYVKHIVPAMWMSTSFERCLDKKKPTIIIEKKWAMKEKETKNRVQFYSSRATFIAYLGHIIHGHRQVCLLLWLDISVRINKETNDIRFKIEIIGFVVICKKKMRMISEKEKERVEKIAAETKGKLLSRSSNQSIVLMITITIFEWAHLPRRTCMHLIVLGIRYRI